VTCGTSTSTATAPWTAGTKASSTAASAIPDLVRRIGRIPNRGDLFPCPLVRGGGCARGAETNFPKGPSDNDLRGKSSFPPRPRCREPSPPAAETETDPRHAVGEGGGGDDERPVGSLPPSKPPHRPADQLARVSGTLGGGLNGPCFLSPATAHETAPPTICPGRSERTGASPG